MNEVATFYNQFHSEHLIYDRMRKNPRIEKIKNLIDGVFSRYNPELVLEIGCSVGVTAQYMIEKGALVFGIDISDKNIAYCKQNISGGTWVYGDFLQAQIPYQFDLICLFDTLEHIEKNNHNAVFERIAEKSHENTKIMITIPDPYFLDYYRKKHPEKLQIIDESIYFEDMYSLLQKHNLEVLAFAVYGIDAKRQYNYYLLGYKQPYKHERI